ncbi:hypothetical protein A2686_05080 [Candidatus Woesebacteria bacterium RIFCSPHIGHO2_01_FULL_38_10]|uniref:DUF5666 domain-containing protein n=1 Tax=Candidatus Woesebacteria bacterium RIFCSPLOWO2_01_FULL_39_10b TaxID=1802517 RepID=A0A1F8B676_9BACT|nr:MAG: hypothetical protein A2686_05080 [Candidatus Woesebacteria bacterium RIFCSPHIGHO2_01_FULL_38_10]OGM59497.1 MAG: hypothetical protein A2892_02520 [Candidatus Woesebacteria bacterium RIFCSPLOWO2_01_FULL_39_10b]
MKKNSIVITVVVALIVAVAAFYGGMQYQQRQRFAGFRGGQNGQQFQGRGNFQGARPVNGEIISQDDKSITVKMQDGSSKIVILLDQTIINKASEGSKSDLKTGEKVAAFGTENSDGSITAQNISIGGMLRVRQ